MVRRRGYEAAFAVAVAALAVGSPEHARAKPPRNAPETPVSARSPNRAVPRAARSQPRPRPERPRSARQSDKASAAAPGGFRLEGDPEISVVFGDSARFRSHIDAFFALRDDMQASRARFSAYVRATVSTLDAHRSGSCPEDAAAPYYARAVMAGQDFRELGAELENHARAITALHDLGETAGLTPDYRWKANRARHLFKMMLVDYREMKTVLEDQLAAELTHRGCELESLLEQGRSAPAPDVADAALAFDPRKPTGRHRALPAGTAPPVTYFVDNTLCDQTMRLVVDGTVEGDIAARRRAAFQASPGRHSMCLIPRSSEDSCGDPGTVRTTFVHDGWSISVRCD